MLDQFIYGQVDRISPEAPIPVFSIREERAMLGGAGNVTRNLVSLGAQVSFVSVIGNDKIGHSIVSMIGKEERVTPYLLTEKNRPSTLKTRYVAGMQQVLRADHETQAPITQETVQLLLDTVRGEIKNHDIVILSDYGKGLISKTITEAVITAAREAKKPVIVDPKSRDFGLYQGASCISPNLNELGAASAGPLQNDQDIEKTARTLMKNHDIEHMLVTRGKDGMTLVSPSEITHIEVRAQEVFDVSGAGDTAIATLSLGVAAGLSWVDAARLANLAAGIVVGRLGTAVVTAQDLKAGLVASEHKGGTHKIMPAAAAQAQVEQWKREGKKIGFTNGCFDLMHSGHLTLLHESRRHCDKLVVAVNSDASVKRLKGPTRPLNGETERALLLASLTSVDLVVIFEQDTPLALIEMLKPSVLVKGSDYNINQVVGREIVEQSGGKVVLVPLKEGYSTTNIIKKMG